MEVFVPSNDDERIRTRYPSVESIEKIHRFYERLVHDTFFVYIQIIYVCLFVFVF